jgi:2-amino-4-hydroxy-6-hydroxymethyldihydropteridine diphosphokinase
VAYIGLGTNLGDRLGNIRKAMAAIRQVPGVAVLRISPIYQTSPVGRTDQPQFLNAVAEVGTGLAPQKLMKALLEIERSLGRVRGEKWGPRTIDLDIVYYGDRTIKRKGLTVPHPEAAKRAFVLAPLCDLAPELVDPVHGKTVAQLLAALDRTGQALKKVT